MSIIKKMFNLLVENLEAASLDFKIKNFKINTGEHILLSGESGSGKTTLLHLIAGLLKPKSGEILIGDFNVIKSDDTQISDFRLKNLGLVFQKLNVLNFLTTKENILLLRESEDDFLDLVLKDVNIYHKKDTLSSLLSLGERQRVALARVIYQRPNFILLDEPTSSLDKKNTAFIMDSLKEHFKEKTLLIVSHDERIDKYFDKKISFMDLIK